MEAALSERYVVWEESTGNGDIWLYDIRSGERHRITGNGARQTYPSISVSRIVWEDYRNGAPDIYLFDLDDPGAGEQRITDDPDWQSPRQSRGHRLGGQAERRLERLHLRPRCREG